MSEEGDAVKRLDHAGLLLLGEGLPERDRELLRTITRLQLVTHAQAAALLGLDGEAKVSAASAARATRRRLRAGSAGYVYYLGPAGQRLVGYWQGQGLIRGRYRPEPGGRYVRHRLAVSQLYVDAVGAARRGELELLDFASEPDCWRTYLDGFGGQHLLKPDAYVRVGLGAYEDRWFIEVDLATESRTVIARKLRAYLAYYRSGEEQRTAGVFPRVLLLANAEVRKAALVEVCTRLPAESWELFTVTTLDRFAVVVTGLMSDDAHERLAGASS
jgi:Replication-relaxation